MSPSRSEIRAVIYTWLSDAAAYATRDDWIAEACNGNPEDDVFCRRCEQVSGEVAAHLAGEAAKWHTIGGMP